MNSLDENDYSAIGRVIVALNHLENFLLRMECVSYDLKKIKTKSYNKNDFQRSMKLNYTQLLESLKKNLGNYRNDDNQADAIIDHFLTKSIDEHGRKVRCTLDAWRNTLHHGSFTKLPNGNIYVSFYDRDAFTSISADPTRIQGEISTEICAAELLRLERVAGIEIQDFQPAYDVLPLC